MSQTADVDKTYDRASMNALGRNLAELWQGMVDTGMPEKEATAVLVGYVQALALKPSEPTE